jgi:hypothetical protein
MLSQMSDARQEAAAHARHSEVARAMQAFARAARARRLYAPNNAALVRIIGDLNAIFDALLSDLGELKLRFRGDAILFGEHRVLEEPDPDDSIPFAFFRDGIRTLELSRGLSAHELEVLLSASREGFDSTALGDDIASYLWRHDLEHVHYVVVDGGMVDADDEDVDPTEPEENLDDQITRLLLDIYGRESEVGHVITHLDAADLDAKSISDRLDRVEEMSPHFHPARGFLEPFAYTPALMTELKAEDEARVGARIILASLEAIASTDETADQHVIAESLLRLFDQSVMGGEFSVAAKIVSGMRGLEELPSAEQTVRDFLSQATAEARLQQVASSIERVGTNEGLQSAVELFHACGPSAVPALIHLLPVVEDPARRRALTELAATIGINDLEPVRALLESEQAFVAREGVHLLSRLPAGPETGTLLALALNHPAPPVRQELLRIAPQLPHDTALELARRLLDDKEPEVVVQAAEVLGRSQEPRAGALLHVRVQRPEFAAGPLAVKVAILSAYAQLIPTKAFAVLGEMLRKGEGLLASKHAEELAIAAMFALAGIRATGVLKELEKASKSLKPRLREAAQQAMDLARQRS